MAIMKTIEERAREAYPINDYSIIVGVMIRGAYIRGAKEQQAIDEEVRLKKSDDMTEAEYDREAEFADWYLKNGKGTPTYSDAIEWARKQTIDEVCNYYVKDEGENHLMWERGILTIWSDYKKYNDGVYADIVITCKYVHQLQQVLRLAGMTELANNFKI